MHFLSFLCIFFWTFWHVTLCLCKTSLGFSQIWGVLKKWPRWQEAETLSANSSVEKLIGSLHWTETAGLSGKKKSSIVVFCGCAYFLNCGINISWMTDTLIMLHQWEAANYTWVDNIGLSFMQCSSLTRGRRLLCIRLLATRQKCWVWLWLHKFFFLFLWWLIPVLRCAARQYSSAEACVVNQIIQYLCLKSHFWDVDRR